MSKDLLGDVFFDSNDKFQEWQLDNMDKTVCAIQPCPKAMELQDDKKPTLDMIAQMQMQVFVTYREPETTTISN